MKGSIQIDITTVNGKKQKATPKTLAKMLKDGYVNQVSEYAAKHVTKKLTLAKQKAVAKSKGKITPKTANLKMKVSRTPDITKNAATIKKNKNMEFKHITPTIAQAYLVVAKLFFKIVCNTPYDERYKYTAYVDRTYTKADKNDNRKLKSMKAVLRTHVPDDEVLRDLWCINLVAPGVPASVYFSTKDFNVDWENENGSGYKTIAKKLRSFYKDAEFTTFHIWNSYQPHDGFNKIMALEYGRYTAKDTEERHTGQKREHGLIGGYSIQAPQGFVRLAWQEVEDADQFASEATQIAKEESKETGKKAKPVYFKAQDIKNNLTFNLQSKNSDTREKAVYAAVEELLDEGIKREDITRRDIARAIAEKRKSVPVTLGDLNKAAKARTRIEKKEQKARLKESEEQRLKKFLSAEEKKKEANRKYWEAHKEEINKERRRKYALEGNISAGGQNLLSDVIQLGTVEGESYSIQGSLNIPPELVKDLLNPENDWWFEGRDEGKNVDIQIRLFNGVLEFNPTGDKDNWKNAAKYLEDEYPETMGKSEPGSLRTNFNKRTIKVLNEILDSRYKL